MNKKRKEKVKEKVNVEETRIKLEELAEKYDEIEEQILDLASTLPDEGGDCSCDIDEREVFRYVHVGNLYTEVCGVCLNCGGYVEVDDPV